MANNAKKPSIDLSALSDISSVVTGMHAPDLNTKLGYFEISVAKIAEDPDQPRCEFEKKSIEELALSIEENGLKQPIAIRSDPERVGKFIVCQGARRLRAYKLKGWKRIPAIFDPNFSRAGQVIENIQRQSLTPQELANYIRGELENGNTVRRIAKMLGKSPAFVFLYKNLLDIKPVAVKDAWDSGKIQDLLVLNDLMHLGKKHASEVMAFVASAGNEITRSHVRILKAKLQGNNKVKGRSRVEPELAVYVSYRDRVATLLLRDIPGEEKVAIRFSDGTEKEVAIQDVALLRVAKA